MNRLKSVLRSHDIKAHALKKIGKVWIVETSDSSFVYKENSNSYDIYEYLKTRDFHNFPRCFNEKGTSYSLTEYITTKDIPNEQKLNDLIHLSGILHRKTLFNKEVDMDKIKEIYESIIRETDYLIKYYNDLNNYIDTVVFMSPAEYLLVSNIDLFYYLLSFVKVEINNWYNFIKEKKILRYSMIHNNLSLDHLLVGEDRYLVSWDKARIDMPVFDLVKLYQDNYYDLDLEYLIREYQKELAITDNEYLFFLIRLAIPKRIEFTKNTYLDCYNINKYIVYLSKIAVLVQKREESHKKV